MAIRTVSNTGGNYNATGTWVEGIVPTSADDVVFTSTSGQLTVNVASAAKSINFTNYVNTITFNQALTVSGNVNLGTGGYTQAGANGIVVNATATLTSGGVTWSRLFTFAGTSITYTLADNWTFSGTLGFNGTTSTIINGNTINIGANLTLSSPAIVSGTTSLNYNGTGTWSSGGLGTIRNNFTINTSGTLTISGNVYYNTGTLTYTTGTVVTTSSTLTIAASTTLSTNGITWNNITISLPAGGTLTTTLNSDLTLTGTLTLGSSSVSTYNFTLNGNNLVTSNASLVVGNSATFTVPQNLTFINVSFQGGNTVNGNQISVTGNLTSPPSSTVSGTTSVVMIGTGTWSQSGTGILRLNLTINTSGTITISGTVYYNTGVLTYTAGTVITTGSTLNVAASTTFATDGIIWNNLTLSGASQTMTLTNNLNVGNTLTISGTGTLTLTGNTLNMSSISILGALVTSGTTTLVFNGTGTWTSIASGGPIRNNLNINTSGTLTITGGVNYNTGTLTYTSGTVVATSSNLNIASNTTLTTNGMTWGNITPSGVTTLTLGNNLVAAGTMTLSSQITFATSGFTVGTLLVTTAGLTQRLVSGQTNIITNAFTCTVATSASRVTIRSTTPGVKSILTLNTNATQDLGFVNATDIDSSGGKKIYSYRGVFSNTDNWATLPTETFAESSLIFFN